MMNRCSEEILLCDGILLYWLGVPLYALLPDGSCAVLAPLHARASVLVHGVGSSAWIHLYRGSGWTHFRSWSGDSTPPGPACGCPRGSLCDWNHLDGHPFGIVLVLCPSFLRHQCNQCCWPCPSQVPSSVGLPLCQVNFTNLCFLLTIFTHKKCPFLNHPCYHDPALN